MNKSSIPNSILEALRGMTKVVADTGDFESIIQFKPRMAGCDLLAISPKLLGELFSKYGGLERKLGREHAKGLPIVMDHKTFETIAPARQDGTR